MLKPLLTLDEFNAHARNIMLRTIANRITYHFQRPGRDFL